MATKLGILGVSLALWALLFALVGRAHAEVDNYHPHARASWSWSVTIDDENGARIGTCEGSKDVSRPALDAIDFSTCEFVYDAAVVQMGIGPRAHQEAFIAGYQPFWMIRFEIAWRFDTGAGCLGATSGDPLLAARPQVWWGVKTVNSGLTYAHSTVTLERYDGSALIDSLETMNWWGAHRTQRAYYPVIPAPSPIVASAPRCVTHVELVGQVCGHDAISFFVKTLGQTD